MRKVRRIQLPADRGFTLVEVLATVALSGAMLLSIVSLFQASIRTYGMARETARSTEIASQQLERLVTLPKTDPELNPGTTTVTIGAFRRVTTVTNNVPAPNSKTVTVTVQRPSSTRQVKLLAVRGR